MNDPFQRSLAIREAKLGKDHPDVASSLCALAELNKLPGKSPMPGYRGVFNSGELDDVIAYLDSLRGAQ